MLAARERRLALTRRLTYGETDGSECVRATIAGVELRLTRSLDATRGIWRESSAEARVCTERDWLLVEHRDFGMAMSADGTRARVVQPNRRLGTENALRVLLARELIRRGGVLLHAAGVALRGGALIAFGRTGSGKSTLAALAGRRPVLGDDLVALTQERGGWVAHSTPFGVGGTRRQQRSVPVHRMARLRHGPAHRRSPLPGTRAVAELVQAVVLPAALPDERARALEICAELQMAHPVEELTFAIDRGVWGVVA